MLFMAIQTNNEMGGGVKTAARFQHGPTPGVKVFGAWVGNGDPARTFITFEAETTAQVNAFTNYLAPYCSHMEVVPVTDFLPNMKAHEARNPDLLPSTSTAQAKELARKYIAAKTVKEAVGIFLASQ